jgi:hypothetical protein
MKSTTLLATLVLAVLSAMPVHADALVNPAPITVPAGVDQAAVHQAVKQALMYRNWVISAQHPGRVDATLYLRGNEARIRIDYDGAQVRLSYVDSRGLEAGMDEGVQRIHGRYLTWIEYLTGDIRNNLDHAPASRLIWRRPTRPRTAAAGILAVAAWRLRQRMKP